MRNLKAILMAAVVVAMCSCGGEKEVQFDKNEVNLTVGQSSAVSVVNLKEAATFTSLKPFIAEVSADAGLVSSVTAKHVGETVVTATSGNVTGSFTVKVNPTKNYFTYPINVNYLGKTQEELAAMLGAEGTLTDLESGSKAIVYSDTVAIQDYIFSLSEDNKVSVVDVMFVVKSEAEMQAYTQHLAEYGELVGGNAAQFLYDYVDAEKENMKDAEHIFILQYINQRTADGLVFVVEYRDFEYVEQQGGEEKALPALHLPVIK